MTNRVEESGESEYFQTENKNVKSSSEQLVDQQAQRTFKRGAYQFFQNVTAFSKAYKFSKQGDKVLADQKIDYISEHGLSHESTQRTTNLISPNDDNYIHEIQDRGRQPLRKRDISRIAEVHDKVSERAVYNEVIKYIHGSKNLTIDPKTQEKITQLHDKITYGGGQPLGKSERDFVHRLISGLRLFEVENRSLDDKIDLLVACQKISSNYQIDNQAGQLSEIKMQSDEFIDALVTTVSEGSGFSREMIKEILQSNPDNFKEQLFESLAESLDCEVDELRQILGQDSEAVTLFIQDKQAQKIEKHFDNDLDKLAEHLLISKEVLLEKKMADPTTYNAYIIKKWKKYGPNGEFDSIMVDARKQFQQRVNNGVDGGLNDYTVKKAYRHALRNLSTNHFPKDGVVFTFDPAKSQLPEAKHFLTGVNEEGNLQIVNWSGIISRDRHAGFLGAGTYGVAQKVYDLASSTFAAIKIAEPKDPSKKKDAEIDVLNEGFKLKEVHKDGVCPGVQEQPMFVFNLSANVQGSTRNVVGTLGKLYNQGNMSDVIMDNPRKPDDTGKRDMALQLLKGGKTLHETMVHGDIKPQNTFVRYDEATDKWYAYIADFGDVKYKTDFLFDGREAGYKNMRVGFGTTASPYHFTKGDMDASGEAVANKSKATWGDLQQRRDVYAIATTVWTLCAGNLPYEFKNENNITSDTSWGVDPDGRKEVEKVLGAKATALLERALAENPMDRPLLDDIISALEFSS